MAEMLDDYSFHKSGGRTCKYPWNDWTNGRVWRVARGVDFDVEVTAFIQLLSVTAGRRKMKVHRTKESSTDVVFQFYKHDAPGNSEG